MLYIRIHRSLYLLTIMLCFLLKLSLPYAHASENTQSVQQTILVLGDSISAGFGIDKEQGWVNLLSHELTQQINSTYKNANIINASISGETSSGGANRIKSLLIKHQPNLVILELGGNDGLRGTPIKLIKKNLGYIIKSSQDSGARVLLLGMQIPPNYGQTYSKLFAQQYQQLTSLFSIDSVPFFLQGIAGVEGMMQDDGIHPTQQAQSIMLNSVLLMLNK